MGETLKKPDEEEVWESPRKKRIIADISRRAINNKVFEDMMLAAEAGEFSREEAIEALKDKPNGFSQQ